LVAIALGRALSIYPLSALLNLGRANKIPVSVSELKVDN